MSENNVSFTVASLLEVTATEQSNLAIPTWLAEALLVGQYWNQSGLLEQLQQQVRVSRGRMGQYAVCGFVLLMLAYAVSGVETLKLWRDNNIGATDNYVAHPKLSKLEITFSFANRISELRCTKCSHRLTQQI